MRERERHDAEGRSRPGGHAVAAAAALCVATSGLERKGLAHGRDATATLRSWLRSAKTFDAKSNACTFLFSESAAQQGRWAEVEPYPEGHRSLGDATAEYLDSQEPPWRGGAWRGSWAAS
jgi:hypothetical protein